MPRRIRLAPEAAIEFRDALLWYDNQEQGLGDRFSRYCGDHFRLIADDPERHPAVGRGFHRYVMQNYPYAVFYEFTDIELIVVSLFNCARDPRIWKLRLRIIDNGD